MLSAGGTILIAVVTAAATISLNELARHLRERAADKRRSADWTVTWTIKDSRIRSRVAIVENVGHTEAFNVQITLTGDPKFETHPDAPLNKCRPRDAILVLVDDVGTGVFKIDWTDAKGIDQGPVFRFPPVT